MPARRPTGHVEDVPRCVAVEDRITSRPEVMEGRRVFRGTRVPVEVLFGDLDDGLTVDEILDSYPTLVRADMLAVIEKGMR